MGADSQHSVPHSLFQQSCLGTEQHSVSDLFTGTQQILGLLAECVAAPVVQARSDRGALRMEGDGVDCVDVVAIAMAFEGEVFGLHAVLYMVHRNAPLYGTDLHPQYPAIH